MERPDCWDFAMDFLGDPEATEVQRYVEALEQQVEDLENLIVEMNERDD